MAKIIPKYDKCANVLPPILAILLLKTQWSGAGYAPAWVRLVSESLGISFMPRWLNFRR